jgi:DEAD/DEAH box helicase domain-containing protein
MAVASLTESPVESFLSAVRDDPRLVHVERLPAEPPRFADLARPLSSAVHDRLGIDRFWTHQATAIDLARDGHHVAIATPTASGKSLCYQAPIAEAVADGLRAATALLVFPTKALAQDQLRALTAMDIPRLVAATYDGDAGTEARTWVRGHANVVLTNPEMLHHGILPNHGRWATFLKRLRYVVVDELHLLRGVFGTHVAHLLRRLQRLCAHYGSRPTFVFSSATIGRPGELASQLVGAPVTAVTDDGAPRGERLFVLWNPTASPERTRSSNRETATLVAELVERGTRTIAFCASRKGTEIVAADVRRRVSPTLADRVRPYRAGYLATERRSIEEELFTGRLLGVVATNALELGVDIGGLDACVLNGFPGTIASMWQQAGRAGRAGDQSIAVLVAGDDQLDQWLMAHPDQVFVRPPEPAVINPSNPFVLHPHLACAAYELPLTHADERWWPGLLDDGVRELVLDDGLRVRQRGRSSIHDPMAVWAGRGWPAQRIGLRGSADDEVRIALEDGTIIGTTDHSRACRQVHPGAVYLHRGQPYRVHTLDLTDGAAIVEVADGNEHTQPRSHTDFTILATDATRQVGPARLALGTVRVRSQVTGYRRIDSFSGELLAVEDLHLPPQELVTRAFWYTVPPEVLARARVAPPAWGGTLHAVEHAAIGMMPLFTICDRWDVGGVSTVQQDDTGLPTIVIYDAHPGGSGIAELGYAAADHHLEATLDVISSCACEDGCPSCVQSPKCGNGNDPLDKAGAIQLLRALIGAPLDHTDDAAEATDGRDPAAAGELVGQGISSLPGPGAIGVGSSAGTGWSPAAVTTGAA